MKNIVIILALLINTLISTWAFAETKSNTEKSSDDSKEEIKEVIDDEIKQALRKEMCKTNNRCFSVFDKHFDKCAEQADASFQAGSYAKTTEAAIQKLSESEITTKTFEQQIIAINKLLMEKLYSCINSKLAM